MISLNPRRRVRVLCALLSLGTAAGAWAGGDEPIPYPDHDPPSSIEQPRGREPSRLGREMEAPRDGSLAHLDDPNIGLAAEVLVGAMMIESSRGLWVEGRLGFGGRFTWEYGRTFVSDDFWRQALFLDVTYAYAQLHDGTAQIFTDSNYHYFAAAPALQFPFGVGSPYGFYLQAGGGLAYQNSVLHTGTVETPVTGWKSLIQYGVGLRGAPRLWEDSAVRISFRLELTRLHRGYMDDTFLGGSLGMAF